MHPTARSTAGVRRGAILPLRLAALPARVTAALVSAIVVAAGAAAVLSAAAPARAAEVADIYTIRVPVDQSEPDWREQAYRRALSQVLVRVTGQRAAAGDPALDALFEDPGRLVQGYRRGADETLWVSFDGRAIAARLREAGRAVWGSERPVTLLWLAVDRGGGDRELIAAEDEPAPGTLRPAAGRRRSRPFSAPARRGRGAGEGTAPRVAAAGRRGPEQRGVQRRLGRFRAARARGVLPLRREQHPARPHRRGRAPAAAMDLVFRR